MTRTITMSAPWPDELDDLVNRARHFEGWHFRLVDGTFDDGKVTGLRLIITVTGPDAYHPDGLRRAIAFHYPVPPVTYDRPSWQRWLFDRVLDVRRHTDGEGLSFEYRRPGPGRDGEAVVRERPFAPFHGPGRDPNRTVEVGVDPEEQRTLQDGSHAEGWWWNGRQVHDDDGHDPACYGYGEGGWCIPVQVVPSDPGGDRFRLVRGGDD